MRRDYREHACCDANEASVQDSLGQATHDWLSHLASDRGHAAETIEAYERDLRQFLIFLKAQLLATKLNVFMGDIPAADPDITPVTTAADNLIGKSSCAPATKNRNFICSRITYA